MAIEPVILNLTSNSGEVVSCLEAGVTCIVGGNNVGKSQMLRDIVTLLERNDQAPTVLSDLTLDRKAVTVEEVAEWLNENAQKIQQQGQPDSFMAVLGSAQLTPSQFMGQVADGGRVLNSARSFYCWYADAGSRLGLGGGSIPASLAPNAHPLAKLLRDGPMGRGAGSAFTTSFRYPLEP
jgi:hypothetical protein